FRNYKLSKRKPAEVITTPKDVFNYVGECIYHLPKEEFYIICLDNAHRVISHKNISTGGNSQVAIDLQDIVQYAIKMKARRVVVLHNHPTATCAPSREDIETTKRLYINFDLSGIELYDHIIVDRTEDFFSFANNGLLNQYSTNFKKMYDEI
ncbi:MAG: JAB domain-containing protein, partial [Clostridia bacterium]|nr:JAB domain-containing protein [Clostridia bacterium]